MKIVISVLVLYRKMACAITSEGINKTNDGSHYLNQKRSEHLLALSRNKNIYYPEINLIKFKNRNNHPKQKTMN